MIMANFPDSLKWAVQKLEVSLKLNLCYLNCERLALSHFIYYSL